jgi:beta-galactosidase
MEARGYKGDTMVLKETRETTGAPAALAMYTDRQTFSADGEDVAMFAVEVRDTRGRIVPVTDNLVTFKVIGAGKLIGTGNGDPTNQESDKGTSRKAFSGMCMAIVQSAKHGESITVQATSPGLAPAQASVWTTPVTLRPQVAAWEREAPRGEGITGLWRPTPDGAMQLFTLEQNADQLSGSVEGPGAMAPITNGKIDGTSVSFRAGTFTYSGSISGSQLELTRTPNFPPRREPANETGPNVPVIGPAPDGSDPSRSPLFRLPGPMTVVLRRVGR